VTLKPNLPCKDSYNPYGVEPSSSGFNREFEDVLPNPTVRLSDLAIPMVADSTSIMNPFKALTQEMLAG